MKNNIYIRSNKSIKTISLTKIFFLIPLMIYGLYKNGIYLYKENYIQFIDIFRPLIYILIGGLIGCIVNIFYMKVVRKSNDDLVSVMFSSFHIEYGIIIGMLTSINTNVILYTTILLIIFLLSKFTNNRVNLICFTLIVIYLISKYTVGYSFLNSYEQSKVFSYEFMDFLIGRYPGGIASTHIILILLSTFGLYMTNNIKGSISLSSIITLIVLFGIYSIISGASFPALLLSNNIIMIMCYVATDTKTSSYTKNGMMFFGILVGILTFLNTFIDPILAPLLSVLIVSLLNNLIDRIANRIAEGKN